VQQTDLPLTEIALACGFASLAVFSRTYRRRFGVAPSRDRRQSVGNTVFRPSPPGPP
jgi:AraC family carnitine catabolism transcriptional activator